MHLPLTAPLERTPCGKGRKRRFSRREGKHFNFASQHDCGGGADFASTPPEHRRAGRRPPRRRAGAAPFWRGRASRNPSGAAPMQGEPVTRGDCLTGVARAGRAPNAGTPPRAGSRWATSRTFAPPVGGPPPCYHLARPIKAAHPLYLGPARGGVGCRGGEPPCRGIRCAQSPRAWRVRPRPTAGVGLLPILERREPHGRYPGSIVHPH